MLGRTLAIPLAFVLALALAGGAAAHALHDGVRGAPPPATTGTSPAATAAAFVVTGHGWGHGIGMSQYGALGYAQLGITYDQILVHYYPGTALGPAPASKVRVLLVANRKKLRVGSDAPFRVADGTGIARQLPAGDYAFGPDLALQLDPAAPPVALTGPLTFTPGTAPLRLKHAYRGTIEVSVVDGKLQAINTVGLEPYLYGVVPREMPSIWAAEALKAQAVAARSYALVSPKIGDFDLFADTRSQVYGGLEAETPATTAAVDATAGQVLLYNGEVARTYFFSTSGGKTAAVTDVWPDADPMPYLVSVDDPYDSLSPYHDWGPVVFPAASVAKKLQVPGLLDLRTTRTASGRVGSVLAIGSGGQVTIRAVAFRAQLGLRSTWFRIGVLALTVPGVPVVYGRPVSLAGLVRGVKGVSLEQRAAPAGWQPVAPVTPARDGTFSTVTRPTATTSYRLTSGDATGTPARVRVAPLVRLYRPKGAATLSGKVRPLLPGATVELQRLDETGTLWTTVATAVVDDKGDFVVPLQPVPGTYRAWLAPGQGFAAGTSRVLQVTS